MLGTALLVFNILGNKLPCVIVELYHSKYYQTKNNFPLSKLIQALFQK